MKRRRGIVAGQEILRRPQGCLGDGFVVTHCVTVDAAGRLIIGADKTGKAGAQIQFRAHAQQPDRGGEMGGMRPFRLGQAQVQKSPPDALDVGFAGKGMVRHQAIMAQALLRCATGRRRAAMRKIQRCALTSAGVTLSV